MKDLDRRGEEIHCIDEAVGIVRWKALSYILC